MNYEILILVVSVCLINLLSFVAGAIVGQKSSRGEAVTIPTPVKVYQDYQVAKEEREEQEKLNVMMANIDAYDGTPMGQRDW
ncbi:MAG: hypothetical protein ACI4LC_05920 [Emergencia sp.]